MQTMSAEVVKKMDMLMPCRRGLHLRVAARFVACIQKFRSRIQLKNGEVLANAKSILDLICLGATWRSKLEIEAVGDDAAQALESIKEFFNKENVNVDWP